MNARAEQKERTHESILGSAARLLRAKGISGASVSDVMQGAGLTVGGFYAHFASKEALIEEALRRTSAELRKNLFQGLEAKPPADRGEVILKRYLSAAHRDLSTSGCPLPAVVGEVGTTAPEYAPVLAAQAEEIVSGLETHLPTPSDSLSRRHVALAALALMFGGLSLARALRGTPLSDEMIKACRAVGRRLVRETP